MCNRVIQKDRGVVKPTQPLKVLMKLLIFFLTIGASCASVLTIPAPLVAGKNPRKSARTQYSP